MSRVAEIESLLLEYQVKVNNDAEHQLKKYRNKGKKLLEETVKKLDIITEDATKFKVEINKDSSAQEKYSQKIYQQVKETNESLVLPEKITRRNLNNYAEAVRNSLHKQDEVLIKYVSLLKDSSYKSKVKSLSNSLKRLNKELSKFEKYILDEYTQNAGIEDVTDLFDDILELVGKFSLKYEEIVEKEADVKQKDKEIADLKNELNILEKHEKKREYEETVENFSKLQRDLDNKFSNIRKALRKFVNLNSKSKNSVDTTLHKEFISDVATTLSKQGGVGGIIAILKDLDALMEKGELKLKKDKREAARNDIKKFIENDLDDNWNLAKQLLELKIATKKELDELDLENSIEKLNATISAAKRDRNRIFERELRDIMDIVDRINKLYSELKTQNYVDIDFNIVLPELPKWAIILE